MFKCVCILRWKLGERAIPPSVSERGQHVFLAWFRAARCQWYVTFKLILLINCCHWLWPFPHICATLSLSPLCESPCCFQYPTLSLIPDYRISSRRICLSHISFLLFLIGSYIASAKHTKHSSYATRHTELLPLLLEYFVASFRPHYCGYSVSFSFTLAMCGFICVPTNPAALMFKYAISTDGHASLCII